MISLETLGFDLKTMMQDWQDALSACLAEREHIGFYNLPGLMLSELKELKQNVKNISEEIDTFVLIGIGGSSLGTQAIIHALKKPTSKKRFFCLDNSDPVLLEEIWAQVDPKKTIWNVVSKSGGTTETLINFAIIYERLKAELAENIKNHIIYSNLNN